MRDDIISAQLVRLNEHLSDITKALNKLVALGEKPKTFGDLIDSLPDPECEPCIDMDHQKGYE